MTPILFNATDSKSCALLLPQEDTQHMLSWHNCLVWPGVSHTTCSYGQLGLLVMSGKSLPCSLQATSLFYSFVSNEYKAEPKSPCRILLCQ